MQADDRVHSMDNLRALAMLAGVVFHAALAYSPLMHRSGQRPMRDIRSSSMRSPGSCTCSGCRCSSSSRDSSRLCWCAARYRRHVAQPMRARAAAVPALPAAGIDQHALADRERRRHRCASIAGPGLDPNLDRRARHDAVRAGLGALVVPVLPDAVHAAGMGRAFAGARAHRRQDRGPVSSGTASGRVAGGAALAAGARAGERRSPLACARVLHPAAVGAGVLRGLFRSGLPGIPPHRHARSPASAVALPVGWRGRGLCGAALVDRRPDGFPSDARTTFHYMLCWKRMPGSG